MALNSFPLGASFWYASDISTNACSQDAGWKLPCWRIKGIVSRWVVRPSQAKRDLSLIHSSLMSSFNRGKTRMTTIPRLSTRMFEPSPSRTSTVSVWYSSHGRALKAYGLDVKAPTGHRSMTFPESSVSNAVSRYVPICKSFPRPVDPSSGAPATSFANRTHLVQWMHLFIEVCIISHAPDMSKPPTLISGPMFLSSTARFPPTSWNLPLSAPYRIDWSCRSHSPP